MNVMNTVSKQNTKQKTDRKGESREFAEYPFGPQIFQVEELPMSHTTTAFLDAALALAARGWRVFPIKPRSKKPPQIKEWQIHATTKVEQIRKWWKKWPDANVGIATGKVSNLLVLDIDPRHSGDDSLAELEKQYGELTSKVEVITGTGGTHKYFSFSVDYEIRNSAGHLGEGLDIRGEGGYVVAPPSIHPDTGRAYAWDGDHQPDETALGDIPEWLLTLLRKPKPKTVEPHAINRNDLIPEGQRNDFLFRLGSSMRNRGMSEAAILAALLEENQTQCRPPLPEAEVQAIAHNCVKYPPGPGVTNEGQATPTRTTAPWPDPPDKVVYHGLAGEFVRLVEPNSEADPMALLLQFLAAFGSVIGRSAYFVAEETRHYLNLFLVIVGMTSKARKGSSWSHVKGTLEACDPVWAATRLKGGLSSGEGLIWQVRDRLYRTQPKKEKGKHTGEHEEICVDLGIDDKRLLVQEAEFSSVLLMTDREGNTLSPIIRKAWETGDLEALTKNSPAKATNAHISIVGHIVQDEVRRYLGRTEVGNGFANRFLWACAKRSKQLPDGGQLEEVHMSALRVRLKQVIDAAGGTQELKRDEFAREIWHKVYGKLSEGAPGLFGAVTSRAEAQVMRVACLYALLDGCSVIKAIHLTASLAVWEYCEASARYIFGDALGDPVADDILRALRESPTGLTRTQISDLFGRNRTKNQIGPALATLLEHGRVRVEREPTPGRDAERWIAI
jgi:hypothetical protein